MIKPYYQEDNITIYHGDCLDIMPQLEPVDLVLTDPPYGINYDRNKKHRGSVFCQIHHSGHVTGGYIPHKYSLRIKKILEEMVG